MIVFDHCVKLNLPVGLEVVLYCVFVTLHTDIQNRHPKMVPQGRLPKLAVTTELHDACKMKMRFRMMSLAKHSVSLFSATMHGT